MGKTSKDKEICERMNCEKCIICQMDNPKVDREWKKKRILDAAEIREDIVEKRLKLLKGEQFVYHMNNQCYKTYTMKKTPDKISVEKKSEDRTRSNTVSRVPPFGTIPPSHLPCVVCGKLQHNGTREKIRICESARANRFIEEAIYFQVDTYTRTADLEEDSRVFGADLYYHKRCIEAYSSKFGRQINPNSGSCNQNQQCSLKREEFLKEKSPLEGYLRMVMEYLCLRSVSRLMTRMHGENFLSNKEIKLFLVESFGSSIQFCQDIVKKMRSLDNIKTAAATIRQSLLVLDIGLDDKFCDAEELKEAWRKKVMPNVLFNILRLRNLLQGVDEGSCANMDNENGNNDADQTGMDERMESFFENQNFTKIHAMFQILFYFVHKGQKKTPLAVITGNTIMIYAKAEN